MDGKPNANGSEGNAAEYLKQTEGDFSRSLTTGLYQPKSEHPAEKIDVHVDARLENPSTIRRPLGSFQDAAANFLSGVALIISLATVLGLALTVKFAYQQWQTMNKTYGEIQKQTAAVQCEAQAAQRSADASIEQMRPLVIPKNITIEAPIEFSSDQMFAEFQIQYLLENIGKEPARVYLSAQIYPWFNPDLHPKRLKRRTKCSCEKGIIAFSIPGTRIWGIVPQLQFPAWLFHVTEGDRSKFPGLEVREPMTIDEESQTKGIDPFIIGCIVYQSTVGDKSLRYTPFAVNISLHPDPSQPNYERPRIPISSKTPLSALQVSPPVILDNPM
jgi:hypothetical protein